MFLGNCRFKASRWIKCWKLVEVFKVRDIELLSRGKTLGPCFLVTVGLKLEDGSIPGVLVEVFKVRIIKLLSRGKVLGSCFLITVGTKTVEGSRAGV